MDATLLISGFLTGMAGSMHCAGMCGPLSLALPVYGLSPARKNMAILLYQAGRVITYTTLGFFVSLAGRMVYTGGFQRWFSIIAGSIILLTAAGYFLQKTFIQTGWLRRFYDGIQKAIIKVWKSNSGPAGFLLMGMANGILPCGMVYIALLMSVSFAGSWNGPLFMVMFGLGTFPIMLMVAYAGQLLKPAVRQSMRKAFPVMITLMGVLLILRGLNLGIPYISPALPGAPGEAVICH